MVIIASIFVLIFSFILFRLAAGNLSLTRPHLISIIFYKDFVLWTFIGVVLIASSFDLNNDLYFWGVTGHVHDQARFYGWLSTMYTMIVFPIGMLLANFLIIRSLSANALLASYYRKPFEVLLSHRESAVFITLCCALFVSFAAILYTFHSMGNFPLFHLIKGTDAVTLAQMRANAKIHFNGIAALRDVLAINLTFFLSLVCYGYKLFYGKGKFSSLFYVSFILVFFILTYNLEKGPVFWYLLSLFAIYIVYRGRLSVKGFVFFLLPVFFLIYVVFSFIAGADDRIYAFAYRLFVAQSVAIFLGFEYFPLEHDFLGVDGISRFYSYISGGELINAGRLLFEIYSPAAIENNTAGFIVGLFNAESWMLFGVAGVLFIPISVGFFVQALNLFFLKSKKTPLYVGLYIYFWTKLSLTGSVAQFLYPVMFVVIFALFFSVILFSKLLRGKPA